MDSRYVHFGVDDGYSGPWQDCGHPGNASPMVCSLAAFEGDLYAGIADAVDAQQACRVFRWGGGRRWTDCGRLGNNPEARSVMSMIANEGRLVAKSDWPCGRSFDLGNPEPLRIGRGMQGSFDGAICDVKLYGGAADAAAIRKESKPLRA